MNNSKFFITTSKLVDFSCLVVKNLTICDRVSNIKIAKNAFWKWTSQR
jgi:hypothetical protein